jgi:hypothetical protein
VGIYQTHPSRRIHYFGRGFTMIGLYLLRQRTSQPVTYTQSHKTHLHGVHFMSIRSSLTLTHFILRHDARARYVVTCTLLQMSAAAAAPAAVVSALQLTPDILATHEVRFISSSTIYHLSELSLFSFFPKPPSNFIQNRLCQNRTAFRP